MPRKPKYHGARALLNLPGQHSTGAVVAEIEDTSTWRKGKNREGRDLDRWSVEPSYTLQISDCSRTVNLDLDLHSGATPEQQENNLHKLDTLIDALTKFRAGVALEQQRKEDRLAALDPED